MPSKVIIIVIEFMFLGINIFWALLRAHFSPSRSSESGPKHIYAREHKLCCFILVIHFFETGFFVGRKYMTISFNCRFLLVNPGCLARILSMETSSAASLSCCPLRTVSVFSAHVHHGFDSDSYCCTS